MTWRKNEGRAPIFRPDHPDQECPAHLFAESEAQTGRVRVRLRNGTEPNESWPIVGRPVPTRWTLTGHGFDIVEWKRS